MKTWQELAKEYYFESHLSINDIAALTEISRQSISGYLKMLPGFKKEKEKRKSENQGRRKEYKKEKKICKSEIIEIGAVKLDEDYNEIDSFPCGGSMIWQHWSFPMKYIIDF